MRCRALAVPEKGKPRAELREYDVPDPGPGEVTVTISASVISPGTERAFSLGLPNTNATFPYHPGYCSAGVVVKTGAGVSRAKEGDRVTCRLGHRSAWTLAERDVLPVRAGVSFEQAAFISLGQIATQGVRRARVELGEGVMVLGLGIIGQLALQLARAAGAAPAVGVDRVARRLAAAKASGADAVLDASAPDWLDALKTLTAGGPQVVFEATGAHEPVAIACQAARRHGRVVLLASTRAEGPFNFYRDVHSPGLTLLGAHAWSVPERQSQPGAWIMDEDMDCFQRLLEDGRVRLDPLVTERVPAERAVAAYEAMLTWNTDMIGTVIAWG